MCLPIAAVTAVVSIAATIASTVMQSQAAQAQSDAAQEQADYQGKVAAYEAELAIQNGEVEQMKYGITARRQYGRQLTLRAAQGVDLGFGSVAEQAIEMRRFQAFDSLMIQRNTNAKVRGIHLRADQAQMEADNIKTAARFTQIGAAIGGTASVAGSVAGFYNAGIFGPGEKTQFKYSPNNPAPRGQGAGVLTQANGGNAPIQFGL